MRILLLTAGCRVSNNGLYKSQVINLAQEFAKLGHSVQIISFLPYFNTDLIRLGFAYERFLQEIKATLLGNCIQLEIIRLPVSSHFQFIGRLVAFLFWKNILLDLLLRIKVRKFQPDVIHCRALTAVLLALRLPRHMRDIALVNFDLRGNAVSESNLLYMSGPRASKRLKKLQDHAIDSADTITCVSKILARQCHIPASSRLYITNIASSLTRSISGNSLDPGSNLNPRARFVYIGSFGKTWYPSDEFVRVAKSIILTMPSATFTILAPDNSHQLIRDVCISESIPVDTISSFTDQDEAFKLTHGCTFGILPYRNPFSSEPIQIELAATVMSTKLSDYICLGLIPIVPQWCTSASELILASNIGFVYGKDYNLAPISKATLHDLAKIKSRISNLVPLFSVEGVAMNQVQFFAANIQAKQFDVDS